MKNRMIYRRFGKTELQMPVLTCGGMRYQQSWDDLDSKNLDEKVQANVVNCINYAFENGINYFDTAPGYCSDRSEDIFGIGI